jgi:hypothetical protein
MLVLLHSFASTLEWLVTEIPKGIFCNHISMLTSQGQKGESSCYLSKVLALGHKLVLGKPSNYAQVGEVVSPPTPILRFTQRDLQYL